MRRYRVRFNGTVNMERAILTKDELKSMMNPFLGGTHVVTKSVGDNAKNI